MEGRRGLEEVGSMRRGSSQMRGLSCMEWRRRTEQGRRGCTFGRGQDGGCVALESVQEPPRKGLGGLVSERRSTCP